MGDSLQPKNPAAPRADIPTALAVLFTAALPSAIAWLRFVVLGGEDASPALRMAVDAIGRITALVFPLLFMILWEPPPVAPTVAARDGPLLGLAFGLVVAAGIFALYYGWLRSSPLMRSAPAQVVAVLQQMGADQLPGYLLLTLIIVVGNSLMEEYYYRWFIFGRLRRLPAAAGGDRRERSGLHVAPRHPLEPLPAGAILDVDGPALPVRRRRRALWAWLYARTGSLYAPWLSHAVIDAAIFVVGWDLMHRV